MRVTCTNCSAVFNLPDEKLEGRTGTVKVRCPRCDTVLDLALEEPGGAEGEGGAGLGEAPGAGPPHHPPIN